MNSSLKRLRYLSVAMLGLSTPLGAQFLNQATLRATGFVELGERQQHPKRLTLSMPVAAALEGQTVCLSYSRWPDAGDADRRVKASCGLWHEGQLVGSERFNGAIELLDEDENGWGRSRFCACGATPLSAAQTGDVLQCEVRFRRLSAVAGDGSVSTSIATVENPRGWCAGF